MKNIKITGILVSAGLIVALGAGLITYNSSEEINTEKASVVESTDSPDINTVANNEELVPDTETPIVADTDSTQQSDTDKVLNKQSNTSNSNEGSNTSNNSNDSTINTNTDIVDKDTSKPNTNTNESNNNTNTQPKPESNNSTSTQPKPEVNKPVVTPPPTTTPDNENENVAPPSPSANFVAEIEQAIFQQVNAERVKNGLPALSYNNTMQKYARIKSQDMGDRNYFAHENPEGQLITAQMQRDGVSYQAWGENIAYIQSSASNSSLANQFMTNWMNSSGHRANILSNNFTSIGLGVYKVGNTYYATQEFYK